MKIRGILRSPALGLVAGLVLCSCAPVQEFRGDIPESKSDFVLAGTNWDGQPFDFSETAGKVRVVFFGYTFCPDICPYTLAKMKQIYRRLGDEAGDLAVVFASVDPNRDSVEKLAAYVPNFDKRFTGLHLNNKELERAMESWDLTVQYSQPQDGPGTNSFYYVDHTGLFFLLDREGRLRVTFPPTAQVADLEADIRLLLAENEG